MNRRKASWIFWIVTFLLTATGWAIPPQDSLAASAGSVIGPTKTNMADASVFQRKSFYGYDCFWVFYSDGTNMVYRSSTDGISIVSIHRRGAETAEDR